MFAVRRLCSRKSRRGTSGSLTRDSIVRKVTMSAAERARSPSVSNDVQPLSLPLTIA